MEKIVWADVESDGIDPHEGCRLLQIATIVTDANLNEIGEGYMAKIWHSEEEVRRMRENTVPFVRDMHDATGLWSSLPTEGKELGQVEAEVLAYLQAQGVEPKAARLGGNSITLDRNFLGVYLPRVLAYLHYRSYDMTSAGGFIRLCRPEVADFKKRTVHDALEDIRESLAEARYYRDVLQAL